ncbi:unnamed protein product [Linum trigynum]|uniref:Uncharacterized protein n=1 Tax=Linum trigynum TaxID=586398 RepID=A0AAV2DUK0_9ROSI
MQCYPWQVIFGDDGSPSPIVDNVDPLPPPTLLTFFIFLSMKSTAKWLRSASFATSCISFKLLFPDPISLLCRLHNRV